MNYKTLYSKYMKILEENKKLKKEIAVLRNIKEYGVIEVDYNPAIISNDHESIIDVNSSDEINQVNDQSTPKEKIALFKELFVGRKDVYAKRWSSKKGTSGYSPVCLNEWVSGVCNKPLSRCSTCNNANYDEFNETAIDRHLRGFEVYGIYPLLIDEMCLFVAVDFDKHEWKDDIKIIRKVCDEFNIPVAIEQSRSGNGAHSWIFFQDAISASLARKLGTAIITYGMSKRHEIKFRSYDRLLPNQDTMPKGGFGNLIALPLQKEARKHGNSEFVDENFQSYTDQWAYLNSIRKMNEEEEKAILNLCNGNEYGDLKSEELEEKPWLRNKKSQCKLSKKDFPREGRIVLANMIYIKKEEFSNKALNSIKRLAAFKNPDFFKAQAMRLPTL